MKTTLDIPDPLFREARMVAARDGTALRAIVTQAVEAELKRRGSARGENPLARAKGRMISMSEQLDVSINGRVVHTVPAELIEVPWGRGAPIGMAADGVLYAGFATESPALESVLSSSDDGGRSWSHRRLDWWQFLDHQPRDDGPSPRFEFWDNRWTLRNDAFGVLADGTLLWAFVNITDEIADGHSEARIIRSSDGGKSWEGPVVLDRSPYPSVGGSSNRMTQLADGTVLWPQRLGLTSSESERIVAAAREAGGAPGSECPWGRSHVFRSEDGGRTWGDRTPLPEWCWEVTLTRLRSGRLVAALRHQTMPDDERQTKRLCLADSDDSGSTWTGFRPVQATADGPSLMEYGQAHGELSELPDGTLVVTYDHRYPYTRQQVLARVSHDQGHTWGPEVYHLTRAGGNVLGSVERGVGSGYASSVVLDDDTIVTMTGAGTCVRWRVG